MRRFRRPTRTLIATVAILAGLLLAATPASAAPGDWWQFGYTAAHTRANPNETTINQQNVATLGIAAQQRPRLEIDLGAGHDAADAGALAVANGLAYANAWNYEGGTSALLAYDTGSFQAPAAWRQERVGCAGRSPAVHLGIVFVGSFPCRPSAANGVLRAFGIALLDVTATGIARIVVYGDPGSVTLFGLPLVEESTTAGRR